MPIDPYAILLRDGKKVDALTDGALKRAEKILGRKLTVTQGSYNAGGVKASAGTHDGGGVVDCPPWDADETVIALRAVGFAAWHRQAIPGLWPEHIHAVLIGHGKLAPVAARQVEAYQQRRDGLKSNAIDTDPGWTNIVRYTVEAFRNDVKRDDLTERIDAKKAERKTALATARKLLGQIKRLTAKRAGIPK